MYNDFPILNNEQYSFLNNQFSNKPDRTFFANNLNNKIMVCISYFNGFNFKVNEKIKQALLNTKLTLEQSLENLKANFKINKNQTPIAKDFNIFSFLKSLTEILNTTNSWLLEEEKFYYKQFIKNLNISIIDSAKKILTALEKSNLHLFKYM